MRHTGEGRGQSVVCRERIGVSEVEPAYLMHQGKQFVWKCSRTHVRKIGLEMRPHLTVYEPMEGFKGVADVAMVGDHFAAQREWPTEFGYRFLADEAEHAGQPMSARTAWRICCANGWWSSFGKKRGRNGKKPGPPVHDDRVERNFTAERTDELWLTDITEHWTDEGKLYLCAIKAPCSGRIVGYSIDSRMQSRLAVTALNSAAARRAGNISGCIVHSDRGSQFRSRRFVSALNRHGLIGSMARESVRRRQRGDGIILRAAAAQRPRPATLEQSRATPDRDRQLDRTDLPPQTPAGPPGPFDAHRIRDHHQHSRISGMTP